ncbi:MAG: hypothetical protein K6G22_11070 [Lachnospiraceae bacterium]|nr:hypothetical protein [Lachnospiraceae bacterium]
MNSGIIVFIRDTKNRTAGYFLSDGHKYSGIIPGIAADKICDILVKRMKTAEEE